MPRATREKVESFLNNINETIDRAFYLESRKENRDWILELGFTHEDVKQTIKGLNVSNYSQGPDKDSDFPGEHYVFGIRINNRETFIKLKYFIREDLCNVGGIVNCISFHPSVYQMKYPYK